MRRGRIWSGGTSRRWWTPRAGLRGGRRSRLRWVPKELRTSFVSMMSYQGVPVEEIARLAGHASSRTTEVIYRRELRQVITTGAEVMDQIFRSKRPSAGTAGAAG